ALGARVSHRNSPPPSRLPFSRRLATAFSALPPPRALTCRSMICSADWAPATRAARSEDSRVMLIARRGSQELIFDMHSSLRAASAPVKTDQKIGCRLGDNARLMRHTVIFETVHGSRAYGLATKASDTDLRGVFVPEAIAFTGYIEDADQIEPVPERVLYEVRKLFRLAAACNPTVIEILFTDPADHVTLSPDGAQLLARKQDFLSRLAGDSFGKYGLAQLHRIRTHRRWLLSPPSRKPERADFGLPERLTIPRDEQGAVEAMLLDGRLVGTELQGSFLEQLDRERRYRAAVREWQQYPEWTRRLTPVRADLERQYGYDTKHAMHLIRLLRMAVEILSTGEVRVRRPDAEELLAVRRGALTFDALLEQADALGSRLKPLADASRLPPRPDETSLNELCAALVAAVQR